MSSRIGYLQPWEQKREGAADCQEIENGCGKKDVSLISLDWNSMTAVRDQSGRARERGMRRRKSMSYRVQIEMFSPRL